LGGHPTKSEILEKDWEALKEFLRKNFLDFVLEILQREKFYRRFFC